MYRHFLNPTLLLLLALLTLGPISSHAQDRPNILWITVEDMSAHLGSYGDPHARTPMLDALAAEATRYSHAFATAPVCAPARSSIITGLYQTSFGSHHMRSNARLPEGIQPFPSYLREAGYYATNNAKEDYNFRTPPETWDESSNDAHWRNRPDPNQPFFSVFNLHTTHESRVRGGDAFARATEDLAADERHDPAALTLPPYYPDTPIVRRDWANYYDVITAMDAQVGAILDELEEDGLEDETIVFFFSDHGVGLPRGKRWLFDSGLHVPLIVRMPEKWRGQDQGQPGTVNAELVSFVDLAPTVMNLAGVEVPDYAQGRAFLGSNLTPERDYVFAARDRMDERYDMIRTVRDHRFRYVRYYEPFKPYYQYMNTPERGATMREIRRVAEAGELPPAAARLMADRKPAEALYDAQADPHNVRDLAGDPAYRDVLDRMREAHVDWVQRTLDIGFIPEPILRDLEEEADASIYTIAREGDGLPVARAQEVAAMWTRGPSAVPSLVAALDASDASVRYWAAISLGNLGEAAASASAPLQEALADPSVTVEIAAARALCRQGNCEPALPVLAQHLREGSQWERLHAALVLDEMGEQALPVVDVMKDQKAYREDMLARGKYTVRVLNRALNELYGTDERVD